LVQLATARRDRRKATEARQKPKPSSGAPSALPCGQILDKARPRRGRARGSEHRAPNHRSLSGVLYFTASLARGVFDTGIFAKVD
jgi:hypothetical protein